MKHMVTDDIIVKYIVGEAEAHEVAMVEQWRKASADNDKQFREFESLWQQSAAVKNEVAVNTDAAWQKVAAKINNKPASKGRVVTMNTRWLVAASLALILGIGYIIFSTADSKQQPLITSNVTAEPLQLQLSDGSKILVKNGSFTYPQQFDGTKRSVQLNKGKAYFDIASDKTKPFEITSGATTITVLGTEFEITAETNTTRLLVKEGKVRFNTPKGELILTAGMGAEYNSTKNTLESIEVKGSNTFAYTSGELNFNNKSLKEVVNDLNNYYEKEVIRLDNTELENCRITTGFNLKREKLEDVIAILSTTLNLESVKGADNTIIIKGKGCR
ncbi:MAG: FecR domain-containing protein [Bacteroidota bacterium]